MSWLRNHIRHFVIPGVRTLVRARESGKTLTPADIKPFDGHVRPATICKYEEAGLLYATIASILAKSDPKREELLALCRTLDGCMIVGDRCMGLSGFDISGPEVVHSMVWSSTRRLKRFMRDEQRTALVLPGRDVWAWEVAGRREGVPTVFDPVVSRSVSQNDAALAKRLAVWGIQDWAKALVFDTGFAGSIPKAIGKVSKQPASMLLLSATDEKNQIFPKHTASRAKAVAIEYFPKYWLSGRVDNGEARQDLADLIEFIRTGLLTLWLWHHVSPRKIAPPKEKGERLKVSTKKSSAYSLTTINPAFYGNISINNGAGATSAYSLINNATTATTATMWDTTGGWGNNSTITGGAYVASDAQLIYKQDVFVPVLLKPNPVTEFKSTYKVLPIPAVEDQFLPVTEFKTIDEVKRYAAQLGLNCKTEIDPTTMSPSLVVGNGSTKAKLALEAVLDLKASFGADAEPDLAQAFAHEIETQAMAKVVATVKAQFERAAMKVLGADHAVTSKPPLALSQITGKPLVG